MATPLVRIPQPQGGTMYSFASFSRDITRVFNNPDLEMSFSNYALLNLPDFTESVNGLNTIDFSKLIDPTGSSYQQGDSNVDWAQTFQGYPLNAEELILKDDDFDPKILQSDAEKLLFKWLNAIGAINFRAADSNESNVGNYAEYSNSSQTGNNYERVVQYLGSIDVENDISYAGNTYHEIYINVPSSIGNTPDVLFKPGLYNTTANRLYTDSQILGRSNTDHPDPNLDMQSVADAYDTTRGLYYNIDTNTTQSLGIDWDDQSYRGVTNDEGVENLYQYGLRGEDFEFNAVLVYYDVYSKSNPARRATNLCGIMLLDDIKSTIGAGSKIPTQIKYKPNEVTGLNGNSFSLKLNLKFNSSIDNVGVETNVNDFTTFSMDLFMDTTSLLKNATDMFIQANNRYHSIAQRVNEIEQLIRTSQETDQLQRRIKQLEDYMQNSSLALKDMNALTELITKANNRINDIINGTIPTDVQYNTDVIFSGDGTQLDKSIPNKIKIHNTNYGYQFSNVFKWDIASMEKAAKIDVNNQISAQEFSKYGVWVKLEPYTNRLSLKDLIQLNNNGIPIADSDLNIYIHDSVGWKNGQAFNLVFPEIDMNGFNIHIKTGYNDNYNTTIGSITTYENGDLISNRPYIQIVCIDKEINRFEVDVIR
jgi:hypothetical protein